MASSSTPKLIGAVVVTAVVVAAATWFITDRSTSSESVSVIEPTEESAEELTAAPGEDAKPSWLFSVTAEGGTFEPGADGTGTLTLAGTAGETTGFTDRPVRDAVRFPTPELAAGWPTLFEDSSPNAVLVSRGEDGTPSTHVLVLEDPVSDGTTLTFTATPVGGQGHSDELPGMVDVAATPPAATLGQVSLFIDSVGPGQTWMCTDGNGRIINPPAPIPYTGLNSAGNTFEAQCRSKGGTAYIVGSS